MNRLPETVSNKFCELFTVMNTATDDLKIAGADALLLGDFSQVGNITDACRQLQIQEMEIKAIVNNIDTNSRLMPSDNSLPSNGAKMHRLI